MAIALVTHTIADSANDNSVTTTGIDTSGSSLLISGFSFELSPNPSLPPVDNKSNTFSDLTIEAGSDKKAGIAYCKNPTVGTAHTNSLNSGGGSSFPTLAFSCWSGVDLTSPFDQENGAHADAVTTLATGSITPSVNGCLIITVITMGNRTLSIDSGFTILDSSPAGAHTDGLGIAYLIQGTAAAVNPIWTVSSGAKLAVRIASFKPASAANALGSYYYRMLAGIEA